MYRFQFTYLKESHYYSIILIDNKCLESFLMVSAFRKVILIFLFWLICFFYSVTVYFLITLFNHLDQSINYYYYHYYYHYYYYSYREGVLSKVIKYINYCIKKQITGCYFPYSVSIIQFFYLIVYGKDEYKQFLHKTAIIK